MALPKATETLFSRATKTRVVPWEAGSNASPSVDAFAEKIGVPGMPCIFADHMDVDPVQGYFSSHESTCGSPTPGPPVGPHLQDFGLPSSESVGQRGAFSEFEATVRPFRFSARAVNCRNRW